MYAQPIIKNNEVVDYGHDVTLNSKQLLMLTQLYPELLKKPTINKSIEIIKYRDYLLTFCKEYPFEYIHTLAQIIIEYKNSFKMQARKVHIRNCYLCGRTIGQERVQSGPYRGSVDGFTIYPEGINVSGFELCCLDCWKTQKVFLTELASEFPGVVSEEISGKPPDCVADFAFYCPKCNSLTDGQYNRFCLRCQKMVGLEKKINFITKDGAIIKSSNEALIKLGSNVNELY